MPENLPDNTTLMDNMFADIKAAYNECHAFDIDLSFLSTLSDIKEKYISKQFE